MNQPTKQDQARTDQPRKDKKNKKKGKPERSKSEDLRQTRIDKIAAIREAGFNPYPERYERSHTTLAAVRALEDETRQTWEAAREAAGDDFDPAALDMPRVKVAGRLVAKRNMGKTNFGALRDITGSIQIMVQRDALDPDRDKSKERYQFFKKMLDMGDFLGVEGPLYFTNKGEFSIQVQSFTFLGKALLPLPDKHGGLQDLEASWRQRYLDLITNDDSRARFRDRKAIISSMRAFLDAHGFDEVETPVLCARASGALARPFIAHHNSLDMEVYLRIAPETYLKRLIVAGYDRVYEFARCFRNEGMDPSHLQDFTMLEFYAAYWNYEDNMDFTQAMIQAVLQDVRGSLVIEYDGQTLDFSGDWPRVPMAELIEEHSGIAIDDHPGEASLLAAIDAAGIALERRDVARGNLIDQLYKKTARPKLINPVFLIKHPTDLSPLARANDDDPEIVDRFQLVVNGWEIVNAYSELVDPIDQRARLECQAAQNAAGDDEAMVMEEDYLEAMEHGMPPISGWGLGIDRFTALLTGATNLRDTVLFPLLRPLDGAEDDPQGAA